MKPLPTMMFASVIVAALAAGAEPRKMTLVKGSPATDSFDISWVDNATQKSYLSDRTSNAIDLVDAATDTFLGSIGKGQYTGSRPCPGRPDDLRHCSGPNGVVTDNLGHVWAGDGAGNLIEASAGQPGAAIIRKIPTGGAFRVDELAYDPIDQILMASSDGDSPPFLTFIAVKDGSRCWVITGIRSGAGWSGAAGVGPANGTLSRRMFRGRPTGSMSSILTSFRIRS